MRSALRRKVVLPVTVVRRNGQEKHLAHTLDLTEVSARLGGLTALLDPGEVIEIQRGGVKAKFQVFWMGTPGSAMEGQAGVRSVEQGKRIWGVDVPEDEIDSSVSPQLLRSAASPTRTSPRTPDERRWHRRYECTGTASAKAAGNQFPARGEIKDISIGGVYMEITSPLPVNTEVTLTVDVEDMRVVATGIVRTSYPLVGMGISFQKMTPNDREKLGVVIERLRRKLAAPSGVAAASLGAAESSEASHTLTSFAELPAHTLATGISSLAENLQSWKDAHSAPEIEDVRKAIALLYQKFAIGAAPTLDLVDYFGATV